MIYVTSFLMVLLSIILDSYVLQQLWVWHLVPLGLPVIGYWQAIGVNTVLSFITAQPVNPKHPDISSKEIANSYLQGSFVRPILFLFIGWVIHRGSL